MAFRPIDAIPTVTKGGVTRPNYDAVRREMELYPQVEGCVAEGLSERDAKQLRKALVKTKSGHHFATVRSGRNLPADCKGPAVVFGGYALTQEQIARAKGTYEKD
jgi:hypothetical protein